MPNEVQNTQSPVKQISDLKAIIKKSKGSRRMSFYFLLTCAALTATGMLLMGPVWALALVGLGGLGSLVSFVSILSASKKIRKSKKQIKVLKEDVVGENQYLNGREASLQRKIEELEEQNRQLLSNGRDARPIPQRRTLQNDDIRSLASARRVSPTQQPTQVPVAQQAVSEAPIEEEELASQQTVAQTPAQFVPQSTQVQPNISRQTLKEMLIKLRSKLKKPNTNTDFQGTIQPDDFRYDEDIDDSELPLNPVNPYYSQANKEYNQSQTASVAYDPRQTFASSNIPSSNQASAPAPAVQTVPATPFEPVYPDYTQYTGNPDAPEGYVGRHGKR